MDVNQKKESNYNVDFDYFEKVTKEAFHFLMTDYGFEHVSTQAVASDCIVEFRNRTTRVEVWWEWQYSVRVILARYENTSTGIAIKGEYDLEFIILTRCPEKTVKQEKFPTHDQLKRTLETYAALLKEYAQDVLTGDFSIFPQLKVLADEQYERTMAEIYPNWEELKKQRDELKKQKN
jgi:hypothetical protein